MKITPEYISQLVNFNSNVNMPEWTFDPTGTDMRNLQVLGAAKIYNLMLDNKVALLADEVGMGKTIQSLAVCAALWNEKPDAKILVIAPRDEVAKNWEKEYNTFITHHYRLNDNIVKSSTGSQPMKKMIYCPNLYSLVHEIQQGWGNLFIGKISSFSSLMAGSKSIERLQRLGIKNIRRAINLSQDEDRSFEFNAELIRLLKDELTSNSQGNKPLFDLVIIDEAHYLRNKNGDSLRVQSATEFFGDPHSDNYVPISSKVLLLTATPNHSSSRDIGSIVSYFTNKFNNKVDDYKNILDQLCVRRLRRLSSSGYNKYNYRQEIASPSDFKENPLSEMFFGLYQHELAKEVNSNKNSKEGNKGVSRMMKYLEGVEFIPQEKTKTENEITDDETKGNQNDYSKGQDANILLGISKKFQEIFNEDPKHPKYDKLVEDLTINHKGEKVLVFVRRITSVTEIAKRIIKYYDRKLWSQLQDSNLAFLSLEKLDRYSFSKATQNETDLAGDDDNFESNIGEEKEGNIPSSKVMNLFKIIKGDQVKYTEASNFRLRFNHSKPNIFAMFFSPGEDYFDSPYRQLKSFRFEVGDKQLENYYNSALIHRTTLIEDRGTSKDILSNLLVKNQIENSGEIRNEVIPTFITIFWDILQSDAEIDNVKKMNIINTYKRFSYYEKEALASFIEKGAILASEAIVWLYSIYRKLQNLSEEKPVSLYLSFMDEVRKTLKDSKLYTQVQESILHFRPIYTKVFSINGDKNLLSESWDSFNNAQPIYPYNAGNSNQKVLRCFNTPFYPDILVATSVLLEGVNLQFFCNTIYHYGMAWTPGDNEQRIGRIDRMFGKIERLLDEDRKSRLNIYYPYLKDTIDEEHLSRFTKRKFNEEHLIDMGQAFQENSDFSLEENDNSSWKNFLREPVENEIKDPFPAILENFNIGNFKKKAVTNPAIDTKPLLKFYHSIANAIEELSSFYPEFFFVNQQSNQKLLIDPTLTSGRKQPVVIDINLDTIGSGYYKESVYCVRMLTPLAPSTKYNLVKNNFYLNDSIQLLYHPGIKLCLDPSQVSGSNWGIYASVELPLFNVELNQNILSENELQRAFSNLIDFADLTEKEIFQRDLKKGELNYPEESRKSSPEFYFKKTNKQFINHGWGIQNYFLILESPLITNGDYEKQSLIENHKNLYVKNYFNNGKWFSQVSFLKQDSQKEELDLLEKHFDFYKKELEWSRK